MGPETFFHASHTVLKRGEMKGLDKNGGGVDLTVNIWKE